MLWEIQANGNLEENLTIEINFNNGKSEYEFTVSAFTLLVGQQQGYLACKNLLE